MKSVLCAEEINFCIKKTDRNLGKAFSEIVTYFEKFSMHFINILNPYRNLRRGKKSTPLQNYP